MAVLIILLWIFIGIMIFGLIIYVINETNFLYFEPKEYSGTDPSKLVHEDASPIYHLKGSENAIMFIHGFTGNPHEWKYYSQKAIDEGFDVITPLQPGAGTSKEDFKKSYFSQWYNHIRKEYIKHRPNYKRFFIAGLSMGGALTLKLAEEFALDDKLYPTAILTISAPVFLNSLFENGALYSPILYLSRIGSWFIDEMESRWPVIEEDGAGRLSNYRGTFPKQTHSLKMGIKPVKAGLHKITMPVFLAHAKGDSVVPYPNMFYIARHVSSKKIKLKSYDISEYKHSNHTLPVYYSTRDDLYDEMMYFIRQNMSVKV
jgi:carboxylesterase